MIFMCFTIDNRGGRRDWKRVYKGMAMRRRMLVTARPLQDDSADSIVQYNYGLVRRYMALCGLVARLNQAWSDWGGKPSSKTSF